MNKFRNWCFTLNNYTEDEIKIINNINCRYCVFGKEVGENNTPHLQGTIVFTSQIVFSTVKKVLPDRCHIEACKFLEESITYCKKDGVVTERGDKPLTKKQQGVDEKARWDIARQQAKETGECDDSKIAIQYARNLDYIYNQELRKKVHVDTTDKHLWYYGETGTGKSRKARGDNPNAYVKLPTKWWDGYRNHEVVIIEDLDVKHDYMGYFLKVWADRYPFPVETKGGGGFNIRPRLIIVTSNWHPKDIWSDEQTLNPLLRRFTVTKFGSVDQIVDHRGQGNTST